MVFWLGNWCSALQHGFLAGEPAPWGRVGRVGRPPRARPAGAPRAAVGAGAAAVGSGRLRGAGPAGMLGAAPLSCRVAGEAMITRLPAALRQV